MGNRQIASENDPRPIIAGFTREDFARHNRSTHARSLRSIIKCTKWLNDHGVSAYVLQYRLSPAYHYPAPMQDGADTERPSDARVEGRQMVHGGQNRCYHPAN